MDLQPGCPFLHCCICAQCTRPHSFKLCPLHSNVYAQCLYPSPHPANTFSIASAQESTHFHASSVYPAQEMIAPVWGNEGPGYGTRASRSCHDFWQENAFSQGDLLTFNGAYPTQGYSRHFAMLSTPQVVADLGYYGATVGANGSGLHDLTALNSPEVSEVRRTMVPQPSYKCGTARKGWNPMPPVHFSTQGIPGVRVLDAFRGRVEGLDGKDSPVDLGRNMVTGRMSFPGYESNTGVKEKLDKQKKIDGRDTARSMQFPTRTNGSPATKGKLAKELAKRIVWYFWDLENNEDLFWFDGRVGEEWRLGQEQMKLGNMVITELKNVSSGSWSPVIYVQSEPVEIKFTSPTAF